MPWQGTVSKVGTDHWDYVDANKYIRDNFDSLHRYVETPQIHLVTVTLTTTATDVVVRTNICPTTPDEGTTLLVLLVATVTVLTGSPTTVSLGLKNQGGTFINPTGAMLTYRYTGAYQPSYGLTGFCAVGSGTNPGFTVRANVDVGTSTMQCSALAWVVLS